MDAQYPAPKYDKKKYNFTKAELYRILAVSVIEEQATLAMKTAQMSITNFLNSVVLPRVKLTPDQDNHLLYDLGTEGFTIWLPRNKTDSAQKSNLTPQTKTDSGQNPKLTPLK